MWEYLNQGLDDVAGRDKDWDPVTGKVERGLLESAGDWIRGYSNEDINKARQRLETKEIRESKGGKAMRRMAKEHPLLKLQDKIAGYDYQTTREDVAADLADAKTLKLAQDVAASQNVNLQGLSESELTNVGILANKGRQQQEHDKYWSAPVKDERDRLYRLEQRSIRNDELDRLDRAEGRRDTLEARLEELDIRRQEQSNKMDIYRQQLANQRADKKQERMMALITGLATLGSGFAL